MVRSLLLAALLLAPAEREFGREVAAALLDGRTASIRERFSRAMERRMPPPRLAELSAEARRTLGPELRVIDERVVAERGGYRYTRVSRHERFPGTVTLTLVVDARGHVDALELEPRPEPAPSPHADRRPTVRLTLPFNGRWHVTWGGRTLDDNYHAVNPNQRFAYDFDVRRDGRTHADDGREVSDYYAFGREILAAADGEVVVAIDGVRDNPPSRPNTKRPAGNHVVIDHGGGEYSIYLHLQRGSLRVRRGDRVERGRMIGRCGNSGSSAVPHLHFHLQDQASFGRGYALPAPFADYLADGEPVASGEPRRGQTVSAAASP